jgi:hypothetical protein
MQPHAVVSGVPSDAKAIVYDAGTTINGEATRWIYVEVHKNEIRAPKKWKETRLRIRTFSETWEFEVHPADVIAIR